MARESSKPMVFLQPAAGMIGSKVRAVLDCYDEYRDAARQVTEGCDIPLPCSTRRRTAVPKLVWWKASLCGDSTPSTTMGGNSDAT